METEFEKNEDIITGLSTLKTDELLPSVNKEAPSFANSLANLLSIKVDRDSIVEQLNTNNVPDDPTMADYLAATMIAKAALGDTKAYEVIRDTCGQKPVEQISQDTTVRIVASSPDIQEYGS